MGSQEGPIESTEDAAIGNEQPIARTKVDTLANGDVKVGDESLVGASLDDAITSPIQKHDIQAGNGSILDEQIETVASEDPIMLEEAVRGEGNASGKEIQSIEDNDLNKDVVEVFGEQVGDSIGIGMEQQEVEQAQEDCVSESPAIDIDRVGSTIVEETSEQAHVQEGLEEETPQSSSLVEDKADGLAMDVDKSDVEEATGLREENLLQEFSSKEDRADEDVKNNDGVGEVTLHTGDEPTITSIDQDEGSTEQVLEVESDVQERTVGDEYQSEREPIAQEVATLPGQDEIVHEAPHVTPLDEEPVGGDEVAIDDSVVDETKDFQGVHEAPLVPADDIEESTNVVDESNVCKTPSAVVEQEVSSASTEFQGIPKQEVATSVEVENNSNEVSDSSPTQDETVEEAPATALVTAVEDATPALGGIEEESVALKGEASDVGESTKDTKGVGEAPSESKGVVDVLETPSTLVKDEVTPTLEDDVEEALPFEEPALVDRNSSNGNSSSLPMQNEVEEAPTGNVKDESPTPLEAEPIVGGEEELKVEDCDVESTKDAQRVDQTPTSPVGESTDVDDEANLLETPSIVVKEEVSPESTQFEGEPEVAKSIDVQGTTEDSVESTEAPLPLEENAHAADSSQVSDSLPAENEIVEQVPTSAIVTTPEDVSYIPVEEEPMGGHEEEFVAPEVDDCDVDGSTKHTEGVDEEPVDIHESKDIADETNVLMTVVKDELTAAQPTEVKTEDESVEINTEESREIPLPLEEPTDVVENDSNEVLGGSPTQDEIVEEEATIPLVTSVEDVIVEAEPVAGGESESLALNDIGESTKHTGAVDEAEALANVEEPKDMVDESKDLDTPSTTVEEDDVESREAILPTQIAQNNSNEDSRSVEELVEEAPAEDVSPPALEEGPTVGLEAKSVNVEDSKVDESAQGVDETPLAPVEVEESTNVVDSLDVVEEKAVLASNQIEGEADVEFIESLPSEEPAQPTQVEIVEGTPTTVVLSSVGPTAEEEGSKAGGEEESTALSVDVTKHAEVVDEAPPAVEQSDESNVLETPLAEEEPKEVVDESNAIETPSTSVEEEQSPTSTKSEGEPEVAEVEVTTQDDVEPEGEAKEAPTLPLVTSVEDVTVEAEAIAGGEDYEVEESTKHGQGVVEAFPAPTEVEESKDVVDEVNVLETPSTVVEEEVTPTSPMEGRPEVAEPVEVTRERLPLEEPTQDSSNEVLATQDEIIEEVPTVDGGEEELLALKVEDGAHQSTEGVEETVATPNEVDEPKDVVDDLEPAPTVVAKCVEAEVTTDALEQDEPAITAFDVSLTPVEVVPIVGGEEEEAVAPKVDEAGDVDVERVDETPTEAEAGEIPLAPSDEAPSEAPLAPTVASPEDAPPTLVEEELADHVGGEQVADRANDADQLVENAQEVDEGSTDVVEDSNLMDAVVEDEVTPTSAAHEVDSGLAPESGGDIESRELPVEGSAGNSSIEESSSALSEQGEVAEEALENPPVTSTPVEDNVVGGKEEPVAPIEADETPAEFQETRDMVDKFSDLEAPSSIVEPTSNERDGEPGAPESTEVEDVMEDAIESLEEEEPAQVVEKSTREEPSVLPMPEEAPAADAPEHNIAAEEHEAPKAEEQDIELNVQLEGVGDGAGSSSELDAEPQKANGVAQQEETEPKDASHMNGYGGLMASTLRSIVTTTMNMVKTTKPSKKKRMKLKKELEAKKMQQD